MQKAVSKHRILREAIRNYLTFESDCSQEGAFEWEIGGVKISFLDLQGCLKNLSKRKKEAVLFNVIYDMKQKDVAKIMGITTVSVGQYVDQAMHQIAKEIFPGEDMIVEGTGEGSEE